jgi:hypothetical protein
LPRCVRGWLWPPRRDTLERSSLKRCCSQSTCGGHTRVDEKH